MTVSCSSMNMTLLVSCTLWGPLNIHDKHKWNTRTIKISTKLVGLVLTLRYSSICAFSWARSFVGYRFHYYVHVLSVMHWRSCFFWCKLYANINIRTQLFSSEEDSFNYLYCVSSFLISKVFYWTRKFPLQTLVISLEEIMIASVSFFWFLCLLPIQY